MLLNSENIENDCLGVEDTQYQLSMLLNSENIKKDCLGVTVEDTQDRISTEHVVQLREY